MPRSALLLLLVSAQGCVSWSSLDHVLVSSEPLGARIVVDGMDTGRTTPARLPIGGYFGKDHTIVLEKTGYRPAARRVCQYTQLYSSRWIDGAVEVTVPPLPVYWTAGDIVFPLGVRAAVIPAELFVRLERDDAPLLGFDVLAAEKAQAANR